MRCQPVRQHQSGHRISSAGGARPRGARCHTGGHSARRCGQNVPGGDDRPCQGTSGSAGAGTKIETGGDDHFSSSTSTHSPSPQGRSPSPPLRLLLRPTRTPCSAFLSALGGGGAGPPAPLHNVLSPSSPRSNRSICPRPRSSCTASTRSISRSRAITPLSSRRSRKARTKATLMALAETAPPCRFPSKSFLSATVRVFGTSPKPLPARSAWRNGDASGRRNGRRKPPQEQGPCQEGAAVAPPAAGAARPYGEQSTAIPCSKSPAEKESKSVGIRGGVLEERRL